MVDDDEYVLDVVALLLFFWVSLFLEMLLILLVLLRSSLPIRLFCYVIPHDIGGMAGFTSKAWINPGP